MQNNIIQGSDEWKVAKQSKIGASEVYSLVFHYCQDELIKLGLNVNKVTERPFRTVQELFMKIKFGAELSDIDPVHSEFGNGMEPYIAHRLGQQLPQIKLERSKEFIVNESFHPLAACSPDGYIETVNDFILADFDKKKEINSFWGKGALELKTANYFANFGAEEGAKLQYIFQHQYQMMVMGLSWGILAALMPKQKEYDEPFFKGKIVERAKDVFSTRNSFMEENLDPYYDLYYYVYPGLPVFQAMILKALDAFQSDLDKYDIDQSVFPRNSEDLAGLQREKKLWAQLWPDHFGVKQLNAEDELNKLLNERYETQVQTMFAEQAFDLIDNQVRQKLKSAGFDKFCEIIGSEQRAAWTKNGQLRFYKLKQ